VSKKTLQIPPSFPKQTTETYKISNYTTLQKTESISTQTNYATKIYLQNNRIYNMQPLQTSINFVFAIQHQLHKTRKPYPAKALKQICFNYLKKTTAN
jgi:hypothetical protein